jgi:hypothetical protein
VFCWAALVVGLVFYNLSANIQGMQ